MNFLVPNLLPSLCFVALNCNSSCLSWLSKYGFSSILGFSLNFVFFSCKLGEKESFSQKEQPPFATVPSILGHVNPDIEIGTL